LTCCGVSASATPTVTVGKFTANDGIGIHTIPIISKLNIAGIVHVLGEEEFIIAL
jgi:hypothetical protein